MEFYKILQQIMTEKGLNIPAVARTCNLSDGTVRSIITRKQNNVALEVAFKLSIGLGVSLERLNGLPEKTKSAPLYSSEAMKLAKDYDSLDKWGQKQVRVTMEVEIARCKEAAIEPEDEINTIKILRSVYKASAGQGFELGDRDQWEKIDIPDTPEARKADFAITITGNSMEPIYSDGQTVLVREQPAVDIGETGIYIINDSGFIKRNGGDHLISINPQYDDIYFSDSDTIRCAGKVIGVVQNSK